jgi:hypothetical protein
MSRDSARFQARSAFSGSGFTTTESESVVSHPVRRRIIMLLMLLGNAGLVTMIATLLGGFVGLEQGSGVAGLPEGTELRILGPDGAELSGYAIIADTPEPLLDGWFGLEAVIGATPLQRIAVRILVLVLGLGMLWAVASSKWVDAQMFKIIAWALKNFTKLDTKDYGGILHLSEGFAVDEVDIDEDHWAVGKTLAELRLADEGIQVLGIRRGDGDYVGTPTGDTFIRDRDTMLVYGRSAQLQQFKERAGSAAGDYEHAAEVSRQRQELAKEARDERAEPGARPEAD